MKGFGVDLRLIRYTATNCNLKLIPLHPRILETERNSIIGVRLLENRDLAGQLRLLRVSQSARAATPSGSWRFRLCVCERAELRSVYFVNIPSFQGLDTI